MEREKKVIKNKDAIWIILIVLVLSINLVLWTIAINKITLQNVSYASTADSVYYKNSIEQFDLSNIINENTKDHITEELLVEQEDIEFTSVYKNNNELPKGTIQVLQEGRSGKQNIITKKIYKNGELIDEQVDIQLIIAAVDKIIEIGSADYQSMYKIKVGDDLYVTSETLAVRVSPNSNSNKNITLNKGSKVKLLEKQDNWFYIDYNNYKGWVQSDSLTYINPNANSYGEESGYSKDYLISGLSKNMNLNKSSGLSLEQFKKVLSGNSSDKNNIFENNAEYFYYAEKQYNINGIFLAAVAIHESNWGTSKIALNKNNLFGYGASDSNPYNNAKSFTTYAEGIDLLARVFVKYYLNPAGTSIYGGEVADGRYYNGSTLSGVNIKYASDKNWGNSVYKWMCYLYDKI